MYRRRDPQRSLFSSSLLVPEVKAARLRNSWAEAFRTRALPLIDEDSLAFLYADGVGRPNRAIQTVLGVLLLKELFDLTDEGALEQLEFNLQWQHALDLTPEEAHLPQKTLHNFRQRLLSHEAGRMIFGLMCAGSSMASHGMGIRPGNRMTNWLRAFCPSRMGRVHLLAMC